MVLFIMKYDINPDKLEAYNAWAKDAIPTILGTPGVVEFRGYRPITGATQVVVTIEFADLTSWSVWYAHEDVQSILSGGRKNTLNVSYELWGPSPFLPEPLRPGG
jgi:antibiotic biosynthesis monooxygenase (ABM) superfamily enzyme